MARPDPGRAYNVADDEPAPPQEVIAYAAELLGMPAPPEVPLEAAGLSPMARSFYGGVASGWRTGGSSESSGWRSPIRTTAPGCAAILAAGG